MSDVCLSSKYYKPILISRHRYNVLFGGRSSAKSDTACQKMINLCREEVGFKGVAIRKVYNTLKDSCYSKLVSIINRNGWENEFYCIKSPLEITHISSGRKIIFRGLDEAEKIKSLDDPTVIWIEEALEITSDDFVKVDTSIRSSNQETLKQMIITFNPENEEHWINKRFFPHKSQYEKEDGSHTFIKSREPNTLLLHTTYKHNDFCVGEDIKTITRLKNAYGEESNYTKVYVYGLWGNALKGLVFENINYVKKMPAKEDCKIYGYGLDFGFTNDPTAIIECALAHGELWAREVTYKTGLVNSGSNSICSELKSDGVKNEEIIADSAEPKSIAEIKKEGFSIKGVDKGKDSIESGITLMKKYKINIVESSTNLIKEFKSYKYKENKDQSESEFSNKPIDAWNHGIDAFRYWCWSNLGKKKEFKVL